MFRDLPPYAQTTQNLFWSAPTPSHWSVQPGLAVLQENRQKNDGLIESQVLSLSYGKVVVKPVEKQRGLVPDSYEGYQILDPGDIVVRPTDLQNDQTSIRVGYVKDRGIITSAYIGLRPTGGWSDSYAYLYLSVVDLSKRIYGMGSGLRQQLGWPDLKRMPCLVPSAEEQAAIVKYLAHANTRIDRAIAAKRRLISLLEEDLKVFVDLMVRDASGPKIPFKSVVRLKEGPGIMAADFRDSGVPLIRISGMHGTLAGVEGCNFLDPGAVVERWDRFRLEQGDFLLSASGSTGEIKAVGPDAVGAVPYTGLIRLRPATDDIDMQFLALFVKSSAFADQISVMKTGVGIEHFGPTHLKRMWIRLPRLEAQASAVAKFEAENDRVSLMRVTTEREITLLQEFRTRLVADVVTGQVDVRAIAARLPDAPESFDNAITATDDDLEEALSEDEE